MRVNGRWLPDASGTLCPTMRVWVQAQGGRWQEVDFLVDTGADRTVFSAELAADLGLPSTTAVELSGVGGSASSVWVTRSLRLLRDDGGAITLKSDFRGLTQLSALDSSLLGRDVLDHFTVIIDRPHNVVCLLAERHQYTIQFV